MSEIRFPSNFTESLDIVNATHAPPNSEDNIRYIQFDLLVYIGEKMRFLPPPRFQNKLEKTELLTLEGVGIFLRIDRISQRLFPFLRSRGYSEEISKACLLISPKLPGETGRRVYWPFYENGNELTPAVPVRRAHLSSCFCGEHEKSAQKRRKGGYALQVNEWEYKIGDVICIQEFSLVTLTFEKAEDGLWTQIPPREDVPNFLFTDEMILDEERDANGFASLYLIL